MVTRVWGSGGRPGRKVVKLCSAAPHLREGLSKKSSCSFGFCPNYLDPPPPNLDNLYHFFFNASVPKNLGRGLPLPPHPQIDPIYTVCEKWTKKLGRAPPPIIWTKSKRTATFFRETFPKLDEDENSFCLRRVTCIFHFDL